MSLNPEGAVSERGDMLLCLTPAELCNLTRRVRHAAQARELNAMGIPYRTRRDGSLVVLRIHVEYETKEAGPPSPEVCL